MTRKPSEWTTLERVRCDLCDKLAYWQHPGGGLRCKTCPRPELTTRSAVLAADGKEGK
jgi:hypothetical protein